MSRQLRSTDECVNTTPVLPDGWCVVVCLLTTVIGSIRICPHSCRRTREQVGAFPTALVTIQFTIHSSVLRGLRVPYVPSAVLHVVENTIDGAFNSHRLHQISAISS